ncbi:hypothetical protein [Marinovum sp.]|uniref:hypothetical protein n=1 Tax=Marinovum sp. TaxID=2024839 RepID=UPI003A9363FE
MAQLVTPVTPELLRRLELHGAAGAALISQLAEAEQLIAQSNAVSGFAHPARRQKARQLAAEGRQLLASALAEAQQLLDSEPAPSGASAPEVRL